MAKAPLLAGDWRSLFSGSANSLSELVDLAEEALFILDEGGIILATNQAAEQLCHHHPNQGIPLRQALPSPELAALVVEMLRMGESELVEQILIAERPYRARLRLLGGRKKRIGVSLQDISELVRLNRARRDLVANISHELRTPIANIRIIIESLFHEKERPKRADSITSLRAIQREADSLQHLAEELLVLSMMETGQVYLRMQPVYLRILVREVCEREEERRELTGVTIHNRVQKSIRVLADREQLRRVLSNLLHNALKWTPAGGEITFAAEENGEEITVTVCDTGPGVPADQATRIFERFYQMDESRSRGQGVGLGLAICHHIVEAHGGRIWAEASGTAGGVNGGKCGGYFAFTLLAS